MRVAQPWRSPVDPSAIGEASPLPFGSDGDMRRPHMWDIASRLPCVVRCSERLHLDWLQFLSSLPAAPIDAHRRPSEANIAKIGKVLDNTGQENNPIIRLIAEFVGLTVLFEMISR